jgi:hypothetical protein
MNHYMSSDAAKRNLSSICADASCRRETTLLLGKFAGEALLWVEPCDGPAPEFATLLGLETVRANWSAILSAVLFLGATVYIEYGKVGEPRPVLKRHPHNRHPAFGFAKNPAPSTADKTIQERLEQLEAALAGLKLSLQGKTPA